MIMKRLFSYFLSIFIVCFTIEHAYALAGKPEQTTFLQRKSLGEGPIALVRGLQKIHDEIARNQPEAILNLKAALEEAGQKMLHYPPSIWEDENNYYALVTYLFIGGDPKIAQPLLESVHNNSVSPALVRGALAYAHNDTVGFIEAFSQGKVDFDKLPIDLRLSIYLGLASEDLYEGKDALQKLDYVRLSAPCTLLEEAALRREVALAYEAEDVELIYLLARNYMTHFPNSPYKRYFWRGFCVAMIKLAPKLSTAQIDGFLKYLPDNLRYAVYLRISRETLIKGEMQRAHHCAKRAMELGKLANDDNQTAEFYYAASSIVTKDLLDAKKILQQIKLEDLSARDRALYAATLKVLGGIIKSKALDLPESQEESYLTPLYKVAKNDIPPLNEGEDKIEIMDKNKQPIELSIPEESYITKQQIEDHQRYIDQFIENSQKQLDAAE